MKEWIKDNELKCNCGKCSPAPQVWKEAQETKRMFNFARDVAGIPFVFSSFIRCTAHNLKEGGSETSSHLYGYAGDVQCSSDASRIKIVMALIAAGFKRIGVSKSFIHADRDPAKPDALWIY